jgi:L-ascorbate metabolism protein UlaG (beta-lactamase superfamily)
MEKPSDHFDGRRYFNSISSSQPSLKDVLLWRWRRKVKPWPFTPIEQKKLEKERAQAGECIVTFINHSTVLIQLEGWNILTDPIWSDRASPFSWIGPKRVTLPGVKFSDLPPIDMVLLSHNHYDHMDLPTLKQLILDHHPTLFVSKGNQAYLKKKGITGQMIELDWWDRIDFGLEHSLYYVPARHFSARGILDRNRTLWGGYVVKGPKHMIYFAGDTGFGPHFAEIRKRLGPPSLSLLPIGAFEPRWFMQSVHISPEEAVEAHLILQSKQSMAIHFGTFQLADEDLESPVLELEKALKEHDLPTECFWVLKPGESRKVN